MYIRKNKLIIYFMFIWMIIFFATPVYGRDIFLFDGIEWQDYTHKNVSVAPMPDGGGEQIKFQGYPDYGYNDFLFYNSVGVKNSQIKFTLDASLIDYHSMDGGGFLFNTNIYDKPIETATGTVYEEYIDGYMALFGNMSILLYRVNMPVNTFNSSPNSYNNLTTEGSSTGDNGILLKRYVLSQSRAPLTDVVIDINDNVISITENGVKIVDSFVCEDKPGSGYGPVACFAPHACSRLSWFGYSKISSAIVSITADKFILGDNTNPRVHMMISAKNLRLKISINNKVLFNQIVNVSTETEFELDATNYIDDIIIDAEIFTTSGESIAKSSLTFNKRNVLLEVQRLLTGKKNTIVILADVDRHYANNAKNISTVAEINKLKRENNVGIYVISKTIPEIFKPMLE